MIDSWVGRVCAFCFNSQFSGLETSYRAVVSELKVWGVVTLKAGENCKSKHPAGCIVNFTRNLHHHCYHWVGLKVFCQRVKSIKLILPCFKMGKTEIFIKGHYP